MTDTEKLNKAIDDAGIMISAIMKALKIKSYSTIKAKINNKSEFTAGEITALCDLLRLSKNQRDEIFFAEKTEFNSVSA